jgi:hypothetical protein
MFTFLSAVTFLQQIRKHLKKKRSNNKKTLDYFHVFCLRKKFALLGTQKLLYNGLQWLLRGWGGGQALGQKKTASSTDM